MKRVLTALLIASCAWPASATTLQEALAEAYKSNPTITGARANQRANDENTTIQRARGLPQINATANYNEYLIRATGNFQSSPARGFFAGFTGSIPVYQGGAVSNGIKAADARIDAGRDTLRDNESTLFANVVAAYMDVIRDEAIVGLNQKQVEVLNVNLRASRDRFQVGDLTRTDVAQSEARLALQRGQLENAQANLITSRETFIRIVGIPPVDLQAPPQLPGLPADPQGAVTTALQNNPGLRAAQKTRDATRYDTGVARASRLPKLSITGQDGYSNYLGTIPTVQGFSQSQSTNTAQAGVALTVPLFQGGAPAAQVRQAQAREGVALENVTATERNVVAQTRSAYAAYEASNALIVSSQAAVDANALSLEGVRAENSVGNRTILDILNAEQELLNSQVNLVSARRNSYVAGFSLLAAMGQAEARDLGLDAGTLYDPVVNYKRVKGRIFDYDSDPRPEPVATRTVDTPAQTSVITGEPAVAPLKSGQPDPTQPAVAQPK
ncbi:Type I secretion protein TolC [Sphingomonas antarctica]|uniref:TolC family outer membrane protein n=1 Tax=Sphingomonas antarctica TaxID=2040274 RepID=UPI0039ED19C9